MENLRKIYNQKIAYNLKDFFLYKNKHQSPKVKKISVNVGLGLLAQNKLSLEKAISEIRAITGQHPIITKAKSSIAGFKIRKGMPVGLLVTLRNDKMYAFLEKFSKLTLPRIRDFQGLSENSIDNHGNYSVGIEDLQAFPEIIDDFSYQKKGCNVCICTTAKTKKEALFLLKELGLPIKINNY